MAASNLRALGGGDIARRGDLIDLLPHLADSGQQAALSIRPHGEDASRVSFRGGQAVADAHQIPVPAVRPGVDAVLTVEVQFIIKLYQLLITDFWYNQKRLSYKNLKN